MSVLWLRRVGRATCHTPRPSKQRRLPRHTKEDAGVGESRGWANLVGAAELKEGACQQKGEFNRRRRGRVSDSDKISCSVQSGYRRRTYFRRDCSLDDYSGATDRHPNVHVSLPWLYSSDECEYSSDAAR